MLLYIVLSAVWALLPCICIKSMAMSASRCTTATLASSQVCLVGAYSRVHFVLAVGVVQVIAINQDTLGIAGDIIWKVRGSSPWCGATAAACLLL